MVRKRFHYMVFYSRSDFCLWICIKISNSCPFKGNASQHCCQCWETAAGASNLQAIIANIKQQPQSTNNHCLWLIDVGSTITESSPSWILTLTYAKSSSVIVKKERNRSCEMMHLTQQPEQLQWTKYATTLTSHWFYITLVNIGWTRKMMTLTRTRCKELCAWYIEDHISLLANSWWFFSLLSSGVLYLVPVYLQLQPRSTAQDDELKNAHCAPPRRVATPATATPTATLNAKHHDVSFSPGSPVFGSRCLDPDLLVPWPHEMDFRSDARQVQDFPPWPHETWHGGGAWGNEDVSVVEVCGSFPETLTGDFHHRFVMHVILHVCISYIYCSESNRCRMVFCNPHKLLITLHPYLHIAKFIGVLPTAPELQGLQWR